MKFLQAIVLPFCLAFRIPISRCIAPSDIPFSHFTDLAFLEIWRCAILAYLPVYHFIHNPIDLIYPTGLLIQAGWVILAEELSYRVGTPMCLELPYYIGPFLVVDLLGYGILLDWVSALSFVTLVVLISLLVFGIRPPRMVGLHRRD